MASYVKPTKYQGNDAVKVDPIIWEKDLELQVSNSHSTHVLNDLIESVCNLIG